MHVCEGEEKAFCFDVPERLVKPLAMYPACERVSRQGTMYSMQFSVGIAHQGKRDVKRHFKGKEHKRLAQVVNSCPILTSFFPDRLSQEKVTNAEVLFTGFILEHNLPFEAAAHAGPLFRIMIPDS